MKSNLQSVIKGNGLTSGSSISLIDNENSNTQVMPRHRVLFLAAEPGNEVRIRLDEEKDKIENEFELSQFRDTISFISKGCIKAADMSRQILKVKPTIVHISGHGTIAGQICIENEIGNSQVLEPTALARLFKSISPECVVLNTCYSAAQMHAIATVIKYVIGMSGEIGVRAAIDFSIGFYQSIVSGQNVQTSFKLGCTQIGLHGGSDDECKIPKLFIDGEEVRDE